tara:strand:- start:115 stop:564 length:450 start_codon:yes stop_codon:yes gene_type:complete
MRPQLLQGKEMPKGMQKSIATQETQITPIVRNEIIKTIQPIAQPTPKGFNLGKLGSYLNDPSVQSIECPGPGKDIIIKKRNRMETIKISLGEEEITTLINNFSKESMIPMMGGILKAAVGDLIISAVISEFVGSRFIINRIITNPRTQK